MFIVLFFEFCFEFFTRERSVGGFSLSVYAYVYFSYSRKFALLILILPYYRIPYSDRTEWELFSLYLFLLSSVFYIYIITVFVLPFIPLFFFAPLLISTSKREEHSPKQKKKKSGNSGKFQLYDALLHEEGGGYFGIIYFLILEKTIAKTEA